MIVAVNERNFTLVRAVMAIKGVRPELGFRSTTFKAPDGLLRQRHEGGSERARNALMRMDSNLIPDYFRECINDTLVESDGAGKHNRILKLLRSTAIPQIVLI